MNSAIITGATGAIGHALIDELINNNVKLLVLVREDSCSSRTIPRHPLLELRSCSLEQLENFENIKNESYDVFYHLAWSGTTGAARNDMQLQNLNVKYTLDAVELAEKFHCRRFVFAGSQAEYGRFSGKLGPETAVFPENGYGMAKLCAGQMSRALCRQLGMEQIWFRVLSVYGPYDGAGSMVMSTINKLKQGIVPEFTKGEQIWDYLYSADAGRAFYLAGEKGIDGKIYVLGSGQGRPLAEYIKIIRDAAAAGAELGLGKIPYAEKQVMHLEADISELQKDTGFKPEVSFNEGIQKILKSWKV